ncbi:kinase-like domain-containing protein [Lophiotrema nucula]|uniref:non-specific serine/threonine protein kinase n=1 Tax=Lophiotrema nucula TaxID=690887 RepID=A0A6A5ZLY5_9PLEO|nr:kinase-like domain-containing protein [Lophiotrema nucula]
MPHANNSHFRCQGSSRSHRSNFERDVRLATPGAFNGGIFLVHDRRHPSHVFIEKRISGRELRDGHAEREVDSLRHCDHPNITEFIHYEIQTYVGYRSSVGRLIIQYCELGDLETMIQNCRRRDYRLPEGFLWSIFWDMSRALCHLRTGRDATLDAASGHSITEIQGWSVIFHRDFKPQNVLLTSRGRGRWPRAVLADFGCSVTQDQVRRGQGSLIASRFTGFFAPPEAPYWGLRSDVYGLGLTMHCLGRCIATPHRGPGRGDPTGQRYSSSLSRSVDECLVRDPADRVSAKNLPATIYRRWTRFENEHPGHTQLPPELFGRRRR